MKNILTCSLILFAITPLVADYPPPAYIPWEKQRFRVLVNDIEAWKKLDNIETIKSTFNPTTNLWDISAQTNYTLDDLFAIIDNQPFIVRMDLVKTISPASSPENNTSKEITAGA
jgi:hypothetical protein